MKKKILFTALMVAALAVVLAVSAFAASVVIDGIYYNLSEAGASVSTDNQKNCTVERVIIPEKVTYDGVEYTVYRIEGKAFGSGNSNGGNSRIKYLEFPPQLQA